MDYFQKCAEIKNRIENDELEYDHDYCAFFDSETNTYYNHAGQQLRHPSEYNQYSEGYTPFGDE